MNSIFGGFSSLFGGECQNAQILRQKTAEENHGFHLNFFCPKPPFQANT